MKNPVKIAFITIFFILAADNICIAAEKLPVFASIVPQKYFVQQIGKDLVDVSVMIPPAADIHTYEPRPSQMSAIYKAKIYFAIGIEFEKSFIHKISSINPGLKIVHTDHNINKIPMTAHHHHGEKEHEHHGHNDHHDHENCDDDCDHDHDAAGNEERHHKHEGLDPHIWLSPPLVKIQAKNILTALVQADPEHKNDYEQNYRDFLAEIDKLDAELKTAFKDKKGMKFIVFHPSWGYFANAYGLEQIPIEVEGKEPKAAQLKELIEHAMENNIKTVFVQPQTSDKIARVVANDIGGKVIFVDPLAEDWKGNMHKVAEKFIHALK